MLVIVIGPYLVRSASLTDDTISIQGDVKTATPIEVFTSSRIQSIRWNGRDMQTTPSNYSTLTTTIPAPKPVQNPVGIGTWRVHDALPERFLNYTDTGPAWVLANRTTTPNPVAGPDTATRPFLFADEYGFHTGIRLWRGHFFVPPSNTTTTSTSSSSTANSSEDEPRPTGVFLNVQGGTAHGWSAYLNGEFLGSWLGSTDTAASNRTLSFVLGDEENGRSAVREGENVLLVVHDDTGHDQLGAAVNPRGILNATLLGGGGDNIGFSSWKVAGTAGGSAPDKAGLDPVRTHYNEGGLVAERLGWHLRGFDDSDWETTSTVSFDGPGVRFYRAWVPLDIPPDIDLSLAFRFTPAAEDVERDTLGYRVLLFVNGWQYARYYPSIASEDTFPVPPGVLTYGGDNLISLAVWSLQEEGARVDLDILVRYVTDSSLDVHFDGDYLRPQWDPERLEYA